MPKTNVALRNIEPNDFQYLEHWWNDHAVADGYRNDVCVDANDTIDRYFHAESDIDNDHRFGRTIVGPGGMCIGHISACGCEDPDRDAVMTMLIGPYFQDHGYGSAAMKLGIRLAVDQLRARTITVKVWSFNLRARHMVESLGFKETSRRHDAVERDGRRFDEVTYRADAADLLTRIDHEEHERETGERLEEQRFSAESQSDRVARR